MSTPVRIQTLVSRDNNEFKVDKNVAFQSEFIKHMVNDAEGHVVNLLTIDGNVLSKVRYGWRVAKAAPLWRFDSPPLPLLQTKVLEYCKYHHDTHTTEEQKAWDTKYAHVDDDMLFGLIVASNFLNIKPLLDLMCTTVAEEIKDKTPEQIRERFNIKNDFTPQEEEETRAQNELFPGN